MRLKETYPVEGFLKIRPIPQANAYFFASEIEIDEESKTLQCYIDAIVKRNATYNDLVALCIETKYSVDEQLALLYNYQSDPVKYADEMTAYQSWRNYCKDACKEYFGVE